MTTYRYASTNLITGEVLSDEIPLNVQSFSQQLNGGGQLSATLNLDENYGRNTAYLEALQPRRSVLWVLADNYPCWCGIVWDSPDMSRAQGTWPVSASTMDSLWSHRLISASLEYRAGDIFTVFLDLLQYGTTKTSTYIESISPFHGPASPLVAQSAAVAGLVLPTGAAATAGYPWTASYLYSDLSQISSAWSDLVTVGLEYAFVPQLGPGGALQIAVQLGFNTGLEGTPLGRPFPASGYDINYPGNCVDYGWQVTGSQSSNYVWGVAPPNGSAEQWESQYPHGVDVTDLDNGYPLMETTESWNGSTVTKQAQVDSFADGQLGILSQGIVTPTLVLPDGVIPSVLDLVLGDQFAFNATSAIHPPGQNNRPGLKSVVRLTGWTVTPPGPQQAGSIQLTTSQITGTP